MFDWDGLVESCHKVAGLDPVLSDSDGLFEGVAALERVRGLVDAAEGHLLAELEARKATDEHFGLSTAGWLAREAGLSGATARTRVKVGAALRTRLANVDEALVEGRVSFDHARVLVNACNPRVADQVAEVQNTLVDLAEGREFEWWRSCVHGIVDRLDADGGHDPKGDEPRSKIRLSPTFGGITDVSGTLAGDDAAIVTGALEAKADELFHRHRATHDSCPELSVPSRAELLAEALVELCQTGTAADDGTSSAGRVDVTVVINATDPSTATTPAGTTLSPTVTRRLLCDPSLHAVLTDSLGVPLDAGRGVRLANRAQRRAIRVRDGGCVFPGCTRRFSWTDLHHVVHWLDGGPTDAANLAPLCRSHHGVTHRKGWAMYATDDHWFWWQTPTGATFWSQRHGHQHPGPAPPSRSERVIPSR